MSRVYTQNCSLYRLPSPIVGWKDGKSNIIAPFVQSALSDVLYVTCPKRSKYALPNLILIPLRYVEATVVLGQHSL